jgi:SH3/ankyrin repeat-containing protein
VSSDQEVTITLTSTASDQVEIIKNQQNQSSFPPPPEPITIESKKLTIISSSVKNSVPVQTDVRSDDEDDQSPSPPLKGFQRHNSLTRKQAATIAANRAKAIQMQQRHAVTLAQLPPPLEADSDEADNGGFSVEPIAPPPPEFSDNVSNHHYQLQPNQQFVQQIVHHQQQQQHHIQQAPQQRSVRIVGAVPKMIHHHHHHHHHH